MLLSAPVGVCCKMLEMKDVKFGLQKDAIFTLLFISILQQTPTGASWCQRKCVAQVRADSVFFLKLRSISNNYSALCLGTSYIPFPELKNVWLHV